MKTIAVMSPKGGIGKTTTADSVAYILGVEMKKKVLLADGDPQGDTSRTYGMDAYKRVEGLKELLEEPRCSGGTYKTQQCIWKTQYEGIDIIPADGHLMQTDMKLAQCEDADQVTRLCKALMEVSSNYDYCICDCGRLLDMVTLNILLAADLIIAPIKVGGFEMDALDNLQEQMDNLWEFNPDVRIMAVMTMRQGNKTSLEAERWLKEDAWIESFQTPIRRSILAEKASIARKPLPEFSKNGSTTKDYRTLTHEIVREMEEEDE